MVTIKKKNSYGLKVNKQAKTSLVLADRLCKQSILLESSKLCLTKQVSP